MAIDYKLPVGQVSGGNFVPDTSMNGTINLRVSPYSTAAYTGTHIADGVYSFGTVATGEYKVYNSGTELTSFGIIKIGESDAVLLTGNQSIAGIKTFTGQPVFDTGLKTDAISEENLGAGITVDGILLKDNLNTSNIVTVNTTQNVTGAKTFTAIQTFSNSVVFQNDIGASPAIYPQVTNSFDQPTLAVHLTPKFYVDNLVSSVAVTPYQQGSNIRRIQSSGTIEAGKLYNTVLEAITNFGSPTATNRLIIKLEKGQADSNYSNIFQIKHSDISGKSYISIAGESRNGTHVILGGTGDSASCTSGTSFENMTIYCTTEVGDRVYGSMKFINCTIYGYKDINFANCELYNCDVVHANGEVPTLSSAGKCLNTTFAQSVTEDSYTGKAIYSDGYDSSPSMPTAPNLGS